MGFCDFLLVFLWVADPRLQERSQLRTEPMHRFFSRWGRIPISSRWDRMKTYWCYSLYCRPLNSQRCAPRLWNRSCLSEREQCTEFPAGSDWSEFQRCKNSSQRDRQKGCKWWFDLDRRSQRRRKNILRRKIHLANSRIYALVVLWRCN